MSKKALIIFAKNPEAGKVKTRLAASIGNESTLAIYHQLLQHTVAETEHLPIDKFVFYSDHIEITDIWNNNNYHKTLQEGTDLGEKMKYAFYSVFHKGYNKVIIIGTDCPDLDRAIITSSFEKLDEVDVVIGPAYDGGYYLLGLKQTHSILFDNMNWSTPDVFPETINKCKASSLLFFLMPMLHDVDEVNDLVYLNKITV